jgi:hypothetical protein
MGRWWEEEEVRELEYEGGNVLGVVLFLFSSEQGTTNIRIVVLDLGLEKVLGYMEVAFFHVRVL